MIAYAKEVEGIANWESELSTPFLTDRQNQRWQYEKWRTTYRIDRTKVIPDTLAWFGRNLHTRRARLPRGEIVHPVEDR